MIEVKDLVKKYPNGRGIDGINLKIKESSIIVLLGPNGAGKSTLISCLLGRGKYYGDVLINSKSAKDIETKRSVGYVPEVPQIFDYLTVEEHLEFVIRAYNLKGESYKLKEELLERYQLKKYKAALGKELSKGNKQKLNIVASLLISPSIWILDEPFMGLDPLGILTLKEDIKRIKKNGIVIISTHLIEMVEDWWDEMYFLNNGIILGHEEDHDKSNTNIIERYVLLMK